MIIKNEVMLSGNYTLSHRYGLEQKEGEAKTTTAVIIGSPSANTIRIEAIQMQDEGDDLFYYSELGILDKFTGYSLESLANRIFYHCPLWTGIKREVNDLDAEKIKIGIYEVLEAIEKLNK